MRRIEALESGKTIPVFKKGMLFFEGV